MSRAIGRQQRRLGAGGGFYVWLLPVLLSIPLLLISRIMISLMHNNGKHFHEERNEEAMIRPQQQQQLSNSGAERKLNYDNNINDGVHDTANNNSEKEAYDDDNDDDEEEDVPTMKKPLNIVLFYADDWSFRTLGAMERALNNTNYKVPRFVKSPNIDKMAENGVLFTHNCVTTSICMVSRASLYTGQYASVHKTYLPEDTAMYSPGVWNQTLFPLLKEHGYHNGLVGKWHHSTPPNVSDTFAGGFNSYFGQHYFERGDETIHVTDANERDAIDFLNKRPKDKPFALLVSFFAIHALDGDPEQYLPQNRTVNLYQNETVPIPKTATEEHFNVMPPFLQNPSNVGRGRWLNRYKTPELYQKMMKRTYRMITEVDTAVGNILQKLKEQNVMDKTLIIFTTDNGNLHGEHGLAEKWYPYEESIRVPLVIVDPRMPKQAHNTINDQYTLNVDLAPTLLGAAQIPIPEVMQGRDIASMYIASTEKNTNVIASWRKEFYYEWFTGHKIVIPASLALVRKDVKYIIYPEYKYEELFQLDSDPYEENNMFNKTSTQRLFDEVKYKFNVLKAAAESGERV